jgi:hypothetical protein
LEKGYFGGSWVNRQGTKDAKFFEYAAQQQKRKKCETYGSLKGGLPAAASVHYVTMSTMSTSIYAIGA